MANKKITDLPAASLPLNETDIVEIVQGGVNKKAPKSGIFTLEQSVIDDAVAAHANLTNNPHSVTKAQVGLPDVDNTSDSAKPVSTAQQTALDLKADKDSPVLTGPVSVGTSGAHADSFSVYSDGAINLHTETNLIVNVHDPVDNDAIGISISPNSMVIAAGEANSTTVTINDENSSTAFSVVANDGSIVITASPGYNITLTADNIILTGNLSNFVYDEVPTGAINGVNTDYTIANLPVKGFQLFWNGMKLRESVGFTRSGVNITMTIAPETGDTLECNYIK